MRRPSGFTTRRISRTLLGTAALSAGLLAHSLIAPATHAAIGGCQSDPVVTLSNGDALDLHATVSDTYDDVQLVSDTLHAPVGTSVTSEVDNALLGPKKTFEFYADEPANTDSAGVKVDTLTPQIPLVAATDLVDVNGTLLSYAWVSGQSQQMLWMNVSG